MMTNRPPLEVTSETTDSRPEDAVLAQVVVDEVRTTMEGRSVDEIRTRLITGLNAAGLTISPESVDQVAEWISRGEFSEDEIRHARADVTATESGFDGLDGADGADGASSS
jgi:hypothetical protein